MPVKRLAPGAGLLALALAAPVGLSAQTAQQESVQQRERPDFTPLGIELDELLGIVGLVDAKTIEQKSSPLSSFVVRPSMQIAGVYESNVFLTENNEVADRRVEYSPGLTIQSDWGRHAFAINATATLGRYDERTSEDFEDFVAQASGRVDLRDHTNVAFAGGIRRRHEARDDEDDPGPSVAPVVSDTLFFETSSQYFADAVLLRFKFRVEDEDFKDSGPIDNDSRDLVDIDVSTRIGYEFTPGTTIFVEPNAEFREFSQKRDASGLLQSNYAYGALFGVTWDLTGVTFAEISAGFARRIYDEPSFDTEDSFDVAGKLVWNATDIMTVTGELQRETKESTTPGESGVLTTTLQMTVDYELLDNVIVTTGLNGSLSDNQELRRKDKDIGASFGVRYLVNANWAANLGLSYDRRDSNTAGESYGNFAARLALTARL